MDMPTLLRKLEAMIDQMKRERTYGQITIAFRDGDADYIRKETTEKLEVQGNAHAKQAHR